MKLEDYLKQLEKDLQSKQLAVGWFSTAKYQDSGTPVAEAAATNEYGNPIDHIPPRPFMRPVFAEKKNEWQKIAAAMIKQNKDSGQILDMLGTTISGQIREKISTIHNPVLSKRTLTERKLRGNSNEKPLNDTGYMIATLTYEIKNVG